MTLRLPSTAMLAAVLTFGLVAPTVVAPVFAAGIGALDPDKDGTVDLKEAQAAASAVFDAADTDKEGTVTAKELGGRLSKKDLKKSDPDADGTLDKNEYLAIVEERFKSADTDGEGTLGTKELSTPAGKALLRLIK